MKTLWGDIKLVTTPGNWGVANDGSPSLDNRDIKFLVDLCKRITSVSKNRRVPVCIDYMPISFYDNEAKGSDTRIMYCSVIPAQSQSVDNHFKICFRTKPHAGTNKNNKTTEYIVDNALMKNLFNYPALMKLVSRVDGLNSLQGVRDALRASNEILAEVARMTHLFRISEFSEFCRQEGITSFLLNTLNPVKVKLESAYKAVCNDVAAGNVDRVIEIAKGILKHAGDVAAAIKTLTDSTLSLAVYVYVSESDAANAAPYLINLSDYSDVAEARMAFIAKNTTVQTIDSINVININTGSLALLKSLENHSLRLLRERVQQDRNAADALNPIIGTYLASSSTGDMDLQAAYNRHMFMANYELLHLTHINRSVYSNAAQNLVSALPEYVVLACKFPGIPNPIFETKSGVCPWNVLMQQGSNGVLSAALYQYATFTNGQYETFDHMIDLPPDSDEFSDLYAVLVPCSLFDSLTSQASANGLFIEPKHDLFRFGTATKENTILHSAYLSAIVMSAMLCSAANDIGVAQIFTSEDGVRLADSNVVAGYYTFDSTADKTKTLPMNVLADNIFGTCGTHVPLNCGEYVNALSYYDLLLYKALVVSKHTPVGIETIKEGLDFTRWLNLNPREVIED